MSKQNPNECCSRFEPAPWDNQTITWDNKLFLKDRVRSVFHIPLNFGAVMKRNIAAMEQANAVPDQMIVLSDEKSLWAADVYIAAAKEVPGSNMTTLSGTFLTKVFEGPYQNMRKWIEEMKSFVSSQGKTLVLLHLLSEMREKARKELRGDPGENLIMKIHWLLAAFLPALIGSIDGSQAPLERETIFCHSIDLRTNALRKLTPLPPLCDEIPSLKKMKVDIGECRLHVETEGDGVPLVLINGGPGGTHHDFHPVFSRAANFARIIYYDQRGCGQSDYRPGTGYSLTQAVHDLERLREELKIERWAVLGWSYGGWLAQHYLLRYPERVRGLVLVGASPAAELNLDSTRQYDFLSRQERRRIQEIYDDASLTPVEAIFNAHAAGDWKRQHYYRPTVEQLARGALYGWKHDPNFRRAIQSHQIEPPNPDRFHGCPVPVLIAEGIWDLTWNTDKPKKFQACFPGAELVLFENSGHAPFQDEPGIFFGKLEQFLTKRPPTETEMAHWKEKLAA
ncbi:MAG TPA: alpha/beta hydrolase, partial [Verrucomicrobiota bacterium]|nr:alpha/beta hydrolase [Verrucomicrobiota bacterium]